MESRPNIEGFEPGWTGGGYKDTASKNDYEVPKTEAHQVRELLSYHRGEDLPVDLLVSLEYLIRGSGNSRDKRYAFNDIIFAAAENADLDYAIGQHLMHHSSKDDDELQPSMRELIEFSNRFKEAVAKERGIELTPGPKNKLPDSEADKIKRLKTLKEYTEADDTIVAGSESKAA